MFLVNSLCIVLLSVLEPIYRLTVSLLQACIQQTTERTIWFITDIPAARIRPPPLLG